jgi:hypothetical protein
MTDIMTSQNIDLSSWDTLYYIANIYCHSGLAELGLQDTTEAVDSACNYLLDYMATRVLYGGIFILRPPPPRIIGCGFFEQGVENISNEGQGNNKQN